MNNQRIPWPWSSPRRPVSRIRPTGRYSTTYLALRAMPFRRTHVTSWRPIIWDVNMCRPAFGSAGKERPPILLLGYPAVVKSLQIRHRSDSCKFCCKKRRKQERKKERKKEEHKNHTENQILKWLLAVLPNTFLCIRRQM